MSAVTTLTRSAPLVTAEQMAVLDRRTIDQLGVPGLVLMESAAWGCVEVLIRRFGDRLPVGVTIAVGPGNNGGDGLAMARRLHTLGHRVEVALVAEDGSLRGDAAAQLEMAHAAGVPVRQGAAEEPLSFVARRWPETGVLVDALLGTGLSRPVEGVLRAAIEALNAAGERGVPILAVDIPSGVSGTTGLVHGVAVQADVTVTFAALKVGHFTGPGAGRRGELHRIDIGIPVERWPDLSDGFVRLSDARVLVDAAPPGPADGHKGTFGHVLVVAGGPGKCGAARLCAEAALRAGAGLVTLAIPARLPLDSLAGIAPEVMLARIPGTRSGTLGAGSAAAVLELLATRDALAIGPGLGTDAETVREIGRLYEEAPVAAVFDADGLNGLALSGIPAGPPRAPRVLTPHPGEMARLLGTAKQSLRSSRLHAARALADRTGAVVVLKGAGTLIAAAGAPTWLNPTGNPGMATAGSGDVLTGIVGAMLGRSRPDALAAALPPTLAAVYWHGLAGDEAIRATGGPSMVAGDLLSALGPAWLTARRGAAPLGYIPHPPG